MVLLVNTPTENGSAWREMFLKLDPSLEVRVWPDVGDPAQVEVVFAWRHQHGDLARYPNLRAVFSLGAGVDGVLADPAFPRQVPLVRMVDPNLGVLMTEYVLAAVLRHHCELDHYQRLQQSGRWEKRVRPFAGDRVVGVMGMGELGARAAGALVGLGFNVRGWSRRIRTLPGLETFAGEAGLTAFLAGTQILVCLLPLTAQTRGILGASTFSCMPRGSCVVNAARGGHLVDADLLAALEGGQLSGATLDVFETEPLPAGHAFWTHPRILVTPHIASVTSLPTAAALVVDNLKQWRAGGALRNVVDPDRGY
ncbi:MAG: glyoxylate/hydroxypyruvate reductase A [Burkholderiales bacterium]|jgi:glyoxylate/hydroxypyruvate reductase|nr:glyoxylate/hydroxypyruvate reductase A [Burkholderiales bacterium]